VTCQIYKMFHRENQLKNAVLKKAFTDCVKHGCCSETRKFIGPPSTSIRNLAQEFINLAI
jgi:hypothetical protein